MSELWVMRRRAELVDAVLHEKPHLTLAECVEIAFDRMIEAHEEPPVDPLLVEARKFAAQGLEDDGCAIVASEVANGRDDENPYVTCALSALRRGIEIGREQP